uniref:ABC transporter domain-containing protein n=1 Tax=Chaetoceros debilis TaxID=122233 RepID=A0A7S3V5X4_9STRA
MAVNYDFIVIGGGSSGSALASNLATKGPTLLIERGANHTAYPQSSVRQGWPQITAIAWDHIQNRGSGHWTGTANILGGGSALNGAVCWRGERSIFESLGFELASVESAFEMLEDRLCTANDDADTEYMNAFRSAWEEHGYEPIDSAPGLSSWVENVTSVTTIQRARTLLPITGTRQPASDLFEDDLLRNDGNLTVFLLTKAKRVLFNDNKVAIGVEINSPSGDASIYIRNGGKVFLNTGAYETPKLLMLSGIGPDNTLAKYGIPKVYGNNAVGQNLIDRKEASIGIPTLKSLEGSDIGVLDYAAISNDYWASIAHTHAFAWGNVIQGCGVCDVKHRTPACIEQMLGALLFYGMGRDSNIAFYYVAQRRPLTRGNVTLASADFRDPPIVHDGWSMEYEELTASNKHDLDVFVDAVQDLVVDFLRNTTLIERLGQSSGSTNEGPFLGELTEAYFDARMAIAGLDDELDQCTFLDYFKIADTFCTNWDECTPSIPSFPRNDRRKVRDIVFKTLASSQHMAGTCKAGAVVDKGTLSVMGVQGLYIGDLSVVTEPVDTHPMMTAMALGLLLGESTDRVPSADFEATPVIMALLGIATVAGLFFLWACTWIRQSIISQPFRHEDMEHVEPQSFFDIFAQNGSQQRKVDGAIELGNVGTELTPQPADNSDGAGIDVSSQQDTSMPGGKRPRLMKWSNVSCVYHTKTPGKSKKSITTLFNNSGCMREGEVTAIMGPSGAAKSTLLDILAGRKSVGAISGTFSVLGRSFSMSGRGRDGLDDLGNSIQGVSAYIPQQEYFYPTQTCGEVIRFTANMKFGKANQKEERTILVRACLDAVGLESEAYASRKIGGELAGGVMVRGLSGGERKRLALASVLALKPKMLFIDELTSGLDSENAFVTMKLLKDLSVKMHVATLIIIHQPSPDTFALFDSLILLSKGRCLFSDSCSNLATFYRSNYDESIPTNTILADDLIVKASAYESFDDNAMRMTVDPSITEDFIEAEEGGLSSITSLIVDGNDSLNFTSISRAFFKLFVIFHRNLVNQYIRNITNVGARLASYSGLSLIIGAVFWKVGITDSDRGLTFEESNIVLRTNLYLMNVSYLLPFSTIPVFFADKKFLAAESALGLYPTWMYGMSQVSCKFFAPLKLDFALNDFISLTLFIPSVILMAGVLGVSLLDLDVNYRSCYSNPNVWAL